MGLNATDREKSKKMLFTGLANSGKTSINLALKRNMSEIGLVKPTYLIDRSIFKYLDYEIIQHDLGGQQKYLISYLREPGRYFSETDAIIFVIDILDPALYAEAIAYYKEVLERLHTLDITPGIWVFFHKAEAIVFNKDEIQLRMVERLKTEIKHINAQRFMLNFNITTIFDHWSIANAFGRIMNVLYSQSKFLSELLRSLADDVNASIIAIIDDNLVPVTSHVNDPRQERLIGYTVPYLYRLITTMPPSSNHNGLISMEHGEYGFAFMKLPNAPISLFILIIGTKETTKQELIQKITEYSPKLLYALLSK